MDVTYDEESTTYTFNQAAVEDEDGFCLADDLVYGVLVESELSKVKMVTLKTRGAGGITTFVLPDGWTAENVHVYCFATTRNGNTASDSVHVTL